MRLQKARMLSLVEASLVTFLWSSSYVLIRIGLEEINPLAFAAYRYFLASLMLFFPFYLQFRKKRTGRFNLSRIGLFLVLGFTGFFIAQGFQFLGLFFLNSVTVTFILNLTPLFVLGLSILFLNEWPSTVQLIGIILTVFGVIIFFYNALADFGTVAGVLITLISGVGWAFYIIISRRYLAKDNESVITLTSISMLFGAFMLLGATGLTGNLVNVSFNGWMIILWLSIVNTAVAFFLWNHALKTLKAVEQSILQNTMLIQIALLAFFFLQESISEQKVLGIIIILSGVLIVQLRAKKERKPKIPKNSDEK
ncbi:MAG: EamA family transporter [Asgard group archaeon]|nr:EamA family transporter [Asgard group archaeon]